MLLVEKTKVPSLISINSALGRFPILMCYKLYTIAKPLTKRKCTLDFSEDLVLDLPSLITMTLQVNQETRKTLIHHHRLNWEGLYHDHPLDRFQPQRKVQPPPAQLRTNSTGATIILKSIFLWKEANCNQAWLIQKESSLLRVSYRPNRLLQIHRTSSRQREKRRPPTRSRRRGTESKTRWRRRRIPLKKRAMTTWTKAHTSALWNEVVSSITLG